MGRLIKISEFRVHEKSKGLDPRWYFTDAHFDSGSGGGWLYHYDVKNCFPFSAAVHFDHFRDDRLANQGECRRRIRRFIERQLSGTVILTTTNKEYSYVVRHEETAFRQKVEHGYNLFHFDWSVRLKNDIRATIM
jgi:hypothetical protein